MQSSGQETGKQAGLKPQPGEHVVTGKEALQHEVKQPEARTAGEPIQVTIGGQQQQQGQQQESMKGSTPADIYPSRTLQQQGQQPPSEQAQKRSAKHTELGAGEGIQIQPMQREVSGLLKEGTGDPDTVDARGTLAVHQERAAIDHSKDDAARHPNAPVDYVDTQQSEGYKSREQAGKTRMP